MFAVAVLGGCIEEIVDIDEVTRHCKQYIEDYPECTAKIFLVKPFEVINFKREIIIRTEREFLIQ
jgi:hypothetical protein